MEPIRVWALRQLSQGHPRTRKGVETCGSNRTRWEVGFHENQLWSLGHDPTKNSGNQELEAWTSCGNQGHLRHRWFWDPQSAASRTVRCRSERDTKMTTSWYYQVIISRTPVLSQVMLYLYHFLDYMICIYMNCFFFFSHSQVIKKLHQNVSRSSGSSGSSSYEIRGTQELRQQMSDHWDQGRLLVSCVSVGRRTFRVVFWEKKNGDLDGFLDDVWRLIRSFHLKFRLDLRISTNWSTFWCQ